VHENYAFQTLRAVVYELFKTVDLGYDKELAIQMEFYLSLPAANAATIATRRPDTDLLFVPEGHVARDLALLQILFRSQKTAKLHCVVWGICRRYVRPAAMWAGFPSSSSW